MKTNELDQDLAIAYLCTGRQTGDEVSENRQKTLRTALAVGAPLNTLVAIRDAVRVAIDKSTVVLPAHRLENLSRGKGWARKGKGNTAEWGDREDGGYRCGEGRWTVGGNDGFSRKGEVSWTVTTLAVGDRTWTIAT